MLKSFRRIARRDGTEIFYTVFHGAAPAVVILHGLAGSSREFLNTAQALSGREVILIDQRGHGKSTRTPADTSREAFVDDVLEVVAAQGHREVDLVGHSMGGHTAMLTAAARPDLVRRLVLLECSAGGMSAAEADSVAEFFRSWEVPFASKESARAFLGNGPLPDAWIADLEERGDGLCPRFEPEAMARTLAGLMAPRWEEWKSITVPVLAVFAENGMFSEEEKRRFVSSGHDVSRSDLAGASHDAHLDRFLQWVDVLRPFVAVGSPAGGLASR